MEMLNRDEHSIDPWGTTIVTSFQLDFNPMIAIPCGPSVQHILCWPGYLLTQPILQQLLQEHVTGDTAERLSCKYPLSSLPLFTIPVISL